MKTAATALLTSPGVVASVLRNIALGGVLIAACGATVVLLPDATPLHAAMALGVTGIAVWMLTTTRYEVTLAVTMLYLGLLDGFLKLKTGSSVATLGRDVLLYAITIGAILRWVIRREPVSIPPLTGWVVAWAAVVLVQVFNPGNGTFAHSLASVRPHLEWLPLFFLGYATMRSKRRLSWFLVLMLVIAAVNGIVGLIQFNLTPEQLSDWGPGYHDKISGEDGSSPRGFVDEGGTLRTRPFGLGGDMGFGGIVGLLAVPAALALLAVRRQVPRFVVAGLSAGVVLAVVTSQARVAVVGSVVAVFCFAALAVVSRGAFRSVVALGVASLVGFGMVSFITSGAEEGAFDRYTDISPSKAASTTYEYRDGTFAQIPRYAVDYPLGAGIGSTGPAATFGGASEKRLNAESQPTYLLVDLGIPGLVVMLCLQLKVMSLAVRRIRRLDDPDLRMLLAGVTAPLLALLATWVVGVSTASTPGAPFVWFAMGTLAWWLIGRQEQEAPEPATRTEPLAA